jgi:hypothetical protein
MSTSLFFLLGSFGAFFSAKEFGDPAFSEWIRPGPGHPFVGDAGRMHELENAIQSLLLGIHTVNRVEGVLLGLGTVGVLLSPFSSNLCQFLTCALVPLEAWYYLVNIVYLPLTGAVEAAVGVLVLGVGLHALCFWRLQSSLSATAPASSRLLLNLYMGYGLVFVAAAALVVYRAPQFEAEMDFFAQVRHYFWTENNMTWTKGMELPDGFDLKNLEEEVAQHQREQAQAVFASE